MFFMLKRFLAALIDLSLFLGWTFGCSYVHKRLVGPCYIGPHVIPVIPLVIWLYYGTQLGISYFVKNKQYLSIGKILLGLEIENVKPEFKGLGEYKRSDLRAFLWIFLLPLNLAGGFLFPLFRKDHRAILDLIAGTKVVEA